MITTSHRWLGAGLLALGLGLALNTLLGPLFTGRIDYPFTDTVRNETLGLEAVSLVLVAPLAILAGLLALRGHRAAPLVALGPSGYAAYMLVQYVVGPQYPSYQPSVAFHLGLLVLSVALLVGSWAVAGREPAPPLRTRWSVVVLLMTAFVVSRWAPAFAAMPGNERVAAAAPDLTMYWSIFMLDLGFVIPAALAAAVGLFAGARWARAAVFGVVGWFALVPPSVAAMAVVKVVRQDPNASTGDTLVFIVVSAIFWIVAGVLFARLFRREDRAAGAGVDGPERSRVPPPARKGLMHL